LSPLERNVMDDLEVLEKHLMAGDAIKLLPKYAEEGH
jgi:hypothetical protein